VLVEKNLPGIGFFRSAFYTPVLASSVVVGLSWQWLLADDGLVNTWLEKAHLIKSAVPFLSDSWLILFSAMGLTLWKGLGWYMIFYLPRSGTCRRSSTRRRRWTAQARSAASGTSPCRACARR